MTELETWIAKAAIAELITRYATLIDAGDWDGVGALYTADARMSRPTAPDAFIVGRTAIVESFKSRPLRASRHIVANILVTLEDDRHASAVSQILLYTGKAAAAGLPELAAAAPLIGTYRDTLVNTESGWRFSERRGSLDFQALK